MKQANIMCFNETFLQPQQELEDNQLPMQDSGGSRGGARGAIAPPQQRQHTGFHREWTE